MNFMPIYYRSDSRPPEHIFEKGFTPRLDMEEEWWHEAIKARGYNDKRGMRNVAVDADLLCAICLSTKLESTPMFPLSNEDSYIYVISLPESTKVEYEKTRRNIYIIPTLGDVNGVEIYKNSYIFTQNPICLYYIDNNLEFEELSISKDPTLNKLIECNANINTPINDFLDEPFLEKFWYAITANAGHSRQNVCLIKNENTPSNIENVLVDLNSFQTTQAKNIISFFNKLGIHSDNLAPYAAWPLYGYETIAYKVEPKNIICAIQVHREKPVYIKERNIDYPLDSIKPTIGYIAKKTKSANDTLFSIENNQTNIQKLSEIKLENLVMGNGSEIISKDRKFQLQGDIILNDKFQPQQIIVVGENEEERQIDYTSERGDAINRIKNAQGKKLETPHIRYGLGGKTF